MKLIKTTLLACVLTVAPAASALAAAGDLDPGFGSGGLVSAPVGAFGGHANAVALQADGKVVAAGVAHQTSFGDTRFGIARFNADGTPDTTFSDDGFAQIPVGNGGEARDVLVQPDGKILAVGNASGGASTSPDFGLVRLNADGTPDSSFGSLGVVDVRVGGCAGTGYSGEAEAVALQPDGKIVVAGMSRHPATSCSSSLPQELTVVRFDEDGAVDTGFATDGEAHTRFGEAQAAGTGVALEPDGTIDVGGWVRHSSAPEQFALVRLSADGDTFGTPLLTTFDGDSEATALVRQGDGSLVQAGVTGSDEVFALDRATGSLALDPSFGTGGKLTTPLGTSARADGLALDAGGRLVAAGRALTGSDWSFAITRYTPAGGLDSAFGSGGKVLTQFPDSTFDYAMDTAVQADGKIVAAGQTSPNGDERFGLARYDAGQSTQSPNATPTQTGVPGVTSPSGEQPACSDKLAPASRVSRRHLRLRRGMLKLSGSSADAGCSGKVGRVFVSLALVRGKGAGRNCRFVSKSGRLDVKWSYCRKPRLLAAAGTSHWEFSLKAKLPRGRYRIVTRAVDGAGNKESPAGGHNVLGFRVR